ncbi:hypothetical protein EP7_000014 [Isosphaeraceae bacterium EP7]
MIEDRRTKDSKTRFNKLPPRIQKLARATYDLFKINPSHSSLHHKPISKSKHPTYEKNSHSVRIGATYRALYGRVGDLRVWYWIGSHEEYNNIVG